MSKFQGKTGINDKLIIKNRKVELDLQKGTVDQDTNINRSKKIESEVDSSPELKWTKEELLEEFSKATKELKEVRTQLQQKETETKISQEAIGEVLLSAEIQARNIVSDAEANALQISELENKKQKEKIGKLKEAHEKYWVNVSLAKELQEGADEVFKEIDLLMNEVLFDSKNNGVSEK